MGKRGRPKKKKQPQRPGPCVECGQPGEYGVDAFGVVVSDWRCRGCYEAMCRRKVRDDFWFRYGQ